MILAKFVHFRRIARLSDLQRTRICKSVFEAAILSDPLFQNPFRDGSFHGQEEIFKVPEKYLFALMATINMFLFSPRLYSMFNNFGSICSSMEDHANFPIFK